MAALCQAQRVDDLMAFLEIMESLLHANCKEAASVVASRRPVLAPTAHGVLSKAVVKRSHGGKFTLLGPSHLTPEEVDAAILSDEHAVGTLVYTRAEVRQARGSGPGRGHSSAPDAITLGTAIHALGKAGRWQEAIALLQDTKAPDRRFG